MLSRLSSRLVINFGEVLDGKELVSSKLKARKDDDIGRVNKMSSSLAIPGNTIVFGIFGEPVI